ncbi:MAG TPA: D-2-hydroxyacid dehydrogenase family protein [Oxalicibacterium sp.]|jgi:D-3-phosphoglycerate dehydrogenase|nr:D-2-hydroxyacid dehydrogenase family protein [Oxalicibacterium sp.]
MNIAILDDYQDCVRRLQCHSLLAGHEVKVFTNSARGIGQLAIRLAPFDALVLIQQRTSITRALLEKLPRLKLISQAGRIGDHIDLAAAAARGVTVTQAAGDPLATAELTWALIMSAMRRLPAYIGNLKDGLWQTVSTSHEHNLPGLALHGRTLCIYGYGRIGRLVAAYGRAFGMDVAIWGGETSRAAAARDGYRIAASKEALFAEADVLSLHLRLHPDTRGIVGANELARMKPHALFVNTAHAALLADDALLAALQAGRPGFAALDVFDSEPLLPTSPLLRMQNVIATPRLGMVEKDSYEKLFGGAFQNIVDFDNGRPRNVATPDAA